MTHWDNRSTKMEDPGEVNAWIQDGRISSLKMNADGSGKAGITVGMNRDGTVADINITNADGTDFVLSTADKAKITAQFPELVGKELAP